MYMTVVCVAASDGSSLFVYAVFHGMEIHEFYFLTRSHSSFPWTGTGETGLKSGRIIGHVLQSN